MGYEQPVFHVCSRLSHSVATELPRLHFRSIELVWVLMISGPLCWSARVFFGHLYKSVHLIDEHHVATVYTSPVVRCLSSANAFPFVVDIASTNNLLLKRECTTESARRLGEKKNQKSEIWRDEGEKWSEENWGESDETDFKKDTGKK